MLLSNLVGLRAENQSDNLLKVMGDWDAFPWRLSLGLLILSLPMHVFGIIMHSFLLSFW